MRPGRSSITRAALAAALLFPAMPAAATVKDGVIKWQSGDVKGAVAEWLPYAARGDADAMFNLGQAYKLGRGVPASPKIAEDYFRKAAELGHTPAQERLGLALYADPARRTEALTWLDRAAAADQPRALYVMGVAYFNGDGVPKNWAQAYGYMLRAAARNVPPARAALETMNASLSIGERAKGEEIAAGLAAIPQTMVVQSAIVPPAKGAAKPPSKPVAVAAVAKTPAKPVASPPAAAANAETPSGWRVQVGAFSARAAAESSWKKLKSSQSALLAGTSPVYQPAGPMLRLQIGPFPARDDAKGLCTKLAAAGHPCFVTGG